MARALALALALVLAAPTAALAQDPASADEERAKELYTNGVTLYDEGRYEEAIAAWEAAYELSRKALLLFNIANAHERLGNYQEAIDALSGYRAFAPADEKELLDRRMRNLERRLDEREATLGTPVTRPEPPAEPVTTVSNPATSTASPEPVGEVTREGGGKTGAWVLVGVGTASLATGTLFGVNALGTGAELAATCATGSTGTYCPDTAEELVKKRRTQAIVADVGVAVGAVTLGTGLTLALLTSSTGPVRIAPTFTAAGGGLALDASF